MRACKVMALAIALLPGLANADPKKLTLLFTGDNRGEIGPCG
ncbi:MAG TPA: hypothetical protein VFV14_02320 [Myxococcaceae bacterium]|nr:hypothetical protein [Myxococcaceae bacterium]